MRIFLLTFLTVCVFRVSAAPETPFRHGRLDNGLTYYIRATGAVSYTHLTLPTSAYV